MGVTPTHASGHYFCVAGEEGDKIEEVYTRSLSFICDVFLGWVLGKWLTVVLFRILFCI